MRVNPVNYLDYSSRPAAILLGIILLIAKAVPAGAAEPDEIYTPIIPSGQYLYTVRLTQFDMNEDGQHGSASFGRFTSDPNFLSLYQSLKFAPVEGFEIETGYGHFFPRDYTRSTLDGPTTSLDTVQDQTLHYFQDYSLNLRLRRGRGESYLNFQEKRQKAKSDAVLLLDDTISFDDINAHYEDVALGLRYLTDSGAAPIAKSYFDLTQPILSGRQFYVDGSLGFQNGKVKNVSDINFAGTLFLRNYFHELRPHYTPSVRLRYGLSDAFEVASGLSYTFPFKYKYEFQQFNPTTTNFISSTYRFTRNIRAPLKITYQPPGGNLSVALSSDFRYAQQQLDAWQKSTTNVFTAYDARKLRYYNLKPALKVSYFARLGKENDAGELAALTKPLLRRGQSVTSLLYQKDVTILKKTDGNGTQNLVNPYNLFLYPLDLFVSGTEHGAFFLGNKTTRGGDVLAQNYYVLETAFLYGLADWLNVGVEGGYRSGSALHHFTFHDLSDRFYRFEPYYYFNVLADWQIRDNSRLSLRAHYVPQYKTFLDMSVNPAEFEVETSYFEASLALKILF